MPSTALTKKPLYVSSSLLDGRNVGQGKDVQGLAGQAQRPLGQQETSAPPPSGPSRAARAGPGRPAVRAPTADRPRSRQRGDGAAGQVEAEQAAGHGVGLGHQIRRPRPGPRPRLWVRTNACHGPRARPETRARARFARPGRPVRTGPRATLADHHRGDGIFRRAGYDLATDGQIHQGLALVDRKIRVTWVSLNNTEVPSEKTLRFFRSSLVGRTMGQVCRQSRENSDGSSASPTAPDRPPVRAWLM